MGETLVILTEELKGWVCDPLGYLLSKTLVATLSPSSDPSQEVAALPDFPEFCSEQPWLPDLPLPLCAHCQPLRWAELFLAGQVEATLVSKFLLVATNNMCERWVYVFLLSMDAGAVMGCLLVSQCSAFYCFCGLLFIFEMFHDQRYFHHVLPVAKAVTVCEALVQRGHNCSGAVVM